ALKEAFGDEATAFSTSALIAASRARRSTRTFLLDSGSSVTSLSTSRASSLNRARSAGAPGLRVKRTRRVSPASRAIDCGLRPNCREPNCREEDCGLFGSPDSTLSVVEPGADERLAISRRIRSSASRSVRAALTNAKFGCDEPNDHHCSRLSL